MTRVKAGITMPPRSAFTAFQRDTESRLQAAALNATLIAAQRAKAKVRTSMSGAGLGRLGNGIDAGGDATKGGAVHRTGTGWSASGWIFIRSKSERTRGAIEAYTEGAEILPRKSPWLWIPTDDIPIRAGRYKMTPTLYRRMGFETKIGPLVQVPGANGTMLLIVHKVGVNAAGKSRSARSLTKRGRARKGQVEQAFIVAFVGIPRTSRQARVDIVAIVNEAQAALPALIEQQLQRR
ncbi:MAG: hypothetical protein JNM03_10515 [Sphingopyxis sp.]|uniref:hypothetical protein n=1 Tax=Sphingopyxis sp. TaxID=1908224 RepID=UPI001A4E48B4|nr:hypothetical protein [Sphingopyxis sp.]MBL9070410.1 hypothetical protein [Sphingopyxis sp.]